MEAAKQPFQEENNNNSNEKRNQNKMKKQEIQSAIAKAMELRALHAALMQQQQANSNNSPNAHLRFPSVLQSPSAHHNPQFSAQDYPVFTPSYEDEAVHNFGIEDGNYNENGVVVGGIHGGDECNQSRKANASSRKGFPSDSVLNLQAVAEEDDQRSFTSSYANANHPAALLSASSPGGPDFCKSKRNSLSEIRSGSSYSYNNNKCNNPASTCKNLVVPLTDLHSSSVHSQPKSHGKMSLLRFLPRLNKKKKNKHSNSPDNRTDPDNEDDVSQSFKVFLSIEALKKELLEANEKRDTALTQVAEMRTSIGELSQKLECLENNCEDLKKALKLAAKTPQMVKKSAKEPKIDVQKGILPVNEEVMIEGFIQMVSEARLSVIQFCKTLVDQIDETDTSLTDSLNFLLLPYKISLHKKFSKTVFNHLEAIINQSLYKDFENCVFQSNGTPKFLDQQQDREFQFSSFVALRNLSWNEVLTKGTKYYSEDLSKFCDQKMSCIIAAMNWTKPWPEQLLQAFFVTAKCIWLLHLLAFSFNPPLRILRVQENTSYDPHFMEDVAMHSHNSSRIKIMVMPGFYVHDRVIRCQVLCRYKSVK